MEFDIPTILLLSLSTIRSIEIIILTTASILMNIISCLCLLSDKYLLFLNNILDISIRVLNYLDIIISCLIRTVLLYWNIF